MKMFRILVTPSLLLAAACGGPTPPPFDDMVVDRFDVPECMDIEPLRMAGETLEDGQRVTRDYHADGDCIEALERSLASLEFKQESTRRFVARRDRGWIEIVSFDPSGADARANVTWEEINP